MNVLFDILQHPLADAVGAALLHFFWQGALVAGVLAFTLYLCRHASPNLRYSICAAALLLMFLLPVATVFQLYWTTPAGQVEVGANATLDLSPGGAISQQNALRNDMPQGGILDAPVPPQSIINTIETRVYAWRQLMFIGWLWGLVFFSLRMAGGLFTLRRLRKNALLIADDPIDKLFTSLIGKMGIKQRVQLGQSQAINQPLLIGWLKPMVLLPAGLVAGMPPAQLEAILAHELTHVRRHDYLVLLGQSVMETVFFYHPAVWWVSYQMSVEREYCCDEVASQVTDKLVYAQALTALESTRMNLALGAGDGQLLDRIRRILSVKESHTGRHRIALGTLLVLVFFSLTALSACNSNPAENFGPPEQFLSEMFQAAHAGEFGILDEIAEHAARQGNICAMATIAELSVPRFRMQMADSVDVISAAFYSIDWFNIHKRKSGYWSAILFDSLKVHAEAGDAGAALWLARMYDSYFSMPFDQDIENDSLADFWYQEAYDKGNNEALYTLALKASNAKERAELYKRAALQGFEPAFVRWAAVSRNAGNMKEYFEVADLSIKEEVAGTHEWLRPDLEALYAQATQGDSLALSWKSLADSLDLVNRLNAAPVKLEPQRYNTNSWMCGKEYSHIPQELINR